MLTTEQQKTLDDFLASIDATTKAALDALHRAHAAGDDPIEIDSDGWMHGTGVTLVPLKDKMQWLSAPKSGGGYLRADHVTGAVAHWTDTRGAGAVNLAKRIAVPGGAARSCHVWIGADAQIAQSAPFKVGTWHAGSSSAALFYASADGTWMADPKRSGLGRLGANDWAAGIEHENVGEVRLVPSPTHGAQWIGWPFRWDYKNADGSIERPTVVPVDEVHAPEGNGRGHHIFPAAQIAASARVYAALVRAYKLLRTNCEWGHCMIDPQLRTDPGPLWLGPKLDGRGGHIKTILDGIYGVTA